MSFNLTDAAKGLLSGNLISNASSFLDESETGVSKALSGVLPVILSGLVSKTNTPAGAENVLSMASEQNNAGILNNTDTFSGNEGSGLLSKGAGLLASIFGDKASALPGLISNFSGIKLNAATSLFSMVTPLLLGLLGKHASTNNLNAGGLASMLHSQKENIIEAMPAGLNLSSLPGFETAAAPVHAVAETKHVVHHTEEVDETGSSLKFLIPLLLLVLVAAGAWYLFGVKPTTTTNVPATATTGLPKEAEAPVTAGPVTEAKGMVDSTGNYVYDLGKMVTLNLPNGAGTLTVGENSTENRLYQFLSDANAKIDTVKGNWFEFTNVRFKTGGAQIDSASSAQLNNIVAISKGFPTAGFKLGGYTDNSGDSAFNVSLSQKRSDAVVASLKKMGALPAAITGSKGYGPQYPIGDNATKEGKAMNRRVAINVKTK